MAGKSFVKIVSELFPKPKWNFNLPNFEQAVLPSNIVIEMFKLHNYKQGKISEELMSCMFQGTHTISLSLSVVFRFHSMSTWGLNVET